MTWLLLNFATLLVLSFYSMMEMATVSFNKLRLQYLVSLKDKRALRLNYLLKNSSRLFGTTLIGVNVAMMFGSECAREFHKAIGVNPDFAPLTQVMIVIIFGELAPMFAARRYAEYTALLGANILYFSEQILRPILYLIDLLTRGCHLLIGGKSEHLQLYLNQDEIIKIIEEHHEEQPEAGSIEELNVIVSNILELRKKTAIKIMQPLKEASLLASNATIRQLKELMRGTNLPFVLLFHSTPSDIVGVATLRDLIRTPDAARISDKARTPWFITHDLPIIQILHQFRSNEETVAIVLNQAGKAIGLLTLQDVLDEIFGEKIAPLSQEQIPLIDRTFPGDMKVSDFNKIYHMELPSEEDETFGELMTRLIGHHPEEGESVSLSPVELVAKEVTLLEVKSVRVTTKLA